MQVRSSLSHKVLILVALPLIVQWGFLFWLFQLQAEAERSLSRSIHAKDIADAINQLRVDMYQIVIVGAGETVTYDQSHEAAVAQFTKLLRDYDDLLRLTRGGDPRLRQAVQESRSESVAGIGALLKIQKSLAENPEDKGSRGLLWMDVRTHMRRSLRIDFAKMAEEQTTLARMSPKIQAEIRQRQMQAMLTLALATLGLTAFSAIYLTRGITLRIAKVSDNAYRLASDRPLNPVLPGNDEIAELDRTFHTMAGALLEASRKERAVVENARDFICSLDLSLRFTAANPAGERLLQRNEKDLIGQSLLSLLPESESQRVKKFFEALKNSGTEATAGGSVIETQILRQQGESLYAVLSAHWAEDEKSYFVVVHDVTDRHQAEELKQEVVVMVTHDLRTPLATLQNILKFLRSGNYGKLDAKGSDYVMVANRNVERMSNLVNDLLDIEKVKSGLMTLDKQAVDLQDCFTAAKELAGAFAEEAGVTISVVPTDLVVDADQDRVTRVLANLIGNAVKFSPHDGVIRVAAKQSGQWVLTAVDDQGPGIPESELGAIFEKFRQVHSPHGKGKGGSGLGLTICQAIVELHGGKIWVENLPAGGSRFIFTLPAV